MNRTERCRSTRQSRKALLWLAARPAAAITTTTAAADTMITVIIITVIIIIGISNSNSYSMIVGSR